jgi:serine/threonine-protein kinase RsbW
MKDEIIFSVCKDREFFGRQREIAYICRRATQPFKSSPGMYLMGGRWMGKTEILRRVYHRLFREEDGVVPVYYQFKGYFNAGDFAEDYVREIIKQFLAFLTRQPRIAREEMPLDELKSLLVDTDMSEMARIISRHRKGRINGDHISVLRNAITAPSLISQQSSLPVFLLLDDFDLADRISFYEGGSSILKEYMDILTSGSFSFLAAGSTNKILEGGGSRCSIEAIELKGLEEGTAVMMMLEMCRRYDIDCDTEMLSLAARLLEGNPMYIKNIIWAAERDERGLASLRDIVDIYVNEVVEGNIAFSLRSAISLGGLNALRVLHACADSDKGVSEKELGERLVCSRDEVKALVDNLSESGLLEINCGLVKWAGDDVVKDFIYYIHETEVRGRSGEEAKTSIVRKKLKAGFYLQGAKVQEKPKEEIAALLKDFKGQRIPKALLRVEDSPARKVEEGRKKGGDDIALPHIVGCFDVSMRGGTETWPSILVAQGFQNERYDEGNEVTWIVGLKETPATVHIGDTENFIRRSRLLREKFKDTRVVRWMVGKEGFATEALNRLGQEGIYSTDGVQLRILKDAIEDKEAAGRGVDIGAAVPIKEFEIVLPMKARSELVAAKAVEEIGEEIGFGENALSEIKTALVEACINAFEHSEVKEGKVHVKFVAGKDRLAIHIQNVGSVFDSPVLSEPTSKTGPALPHKRGWGIALMKRLMDDVRFEKIRGGTWLVMVKYLKRNGEDGNGKETAKF